MQLIDAGTTGNSETPFHPIPSDLPAPWAKVLSILAPQGNLRPVQHAHLTPVLNDLANLIVQAPTNAGKSMVGILACLRAIHSGKRAVLIEPLKAIAQEQAEQMQALQGPLGRSLGCDLQIRLTTGDYRLTDEFFADPPPKAGHLIIATPERLEVILRNPDHDAWISSIGCICVDEAHLLGDRRRGPGLETTLTHCLGLPTPPRIVLLSATLGDTESLARWLRAAEPIPAPPRTPPLTMQVGRVSKDDKQQALVDHCRSILADPGTSVLIFACTTARVSKLARDLEGALGANAVGAAGAGAFHSQRSAAERASVRTAVLDGTCRLVVATTALAMGVNLPTTHVVIADATRHDQGEHMALPVNEVIQMCGRAGRGDTAGQALVLLTDAEPVDANQLAIHLREQRALDLASPFSYMGQADPQTTTITVADRIGALLTRFPDGLSPGAIRDHFANSWGGTYLAPMVEAGVRYLETCFGHHHFDGERKPVGLAWRSEGRCKLTHLGLDSFRAAAPLRLTVGIAHLFRDLMQIDAEDNILRHAKPLDLLLLLEMRRGRTWNLGKTKATAKVHKQVNQAMPSTPGEPSVIFNTYLFTDGIDKGSTRTSNAEGVFGSLYPNNEEHPKEHKAWSSAYLATLRAMVLNDLINGRALEEVAAQYDITNLNGIQEQWRDDTQWLLSALMPCLDHKAYLHHLKRICHADEQREMVVKAAFQNLRGHAYDLMEGLKYCSPLGDFLRDLRSGRAGKGKQVMGSGSIDRLRKAGMQSRGDILARFPNVRGDPDESDAASADIEALAKIVGRRAFAMQVRAALRRQG